MNTEPVNTPSIDESSECLSTSAYIRALVHELNVDVTFEAALGTWFVVTIMAAVSFMGSVPPDRAGDFFDVATRPALYVFFYGVLANAALLGYLCCYHTVRYIASAHFRAMDRINKS